MVDLKLNNNITGLKKSDFQEVINGKQIDLFFLANSNGVQIAVTNYGCATVAIMVPNKNGEFANIILGHDTIDGVINSSESFLSTVIGRYRNRIDKGKFILKGREYSLPTKENWKYSLHGGPKGFHRKVWDACQNDKHEVKFKYISKDGEMGFPGELKINMTYTLSENNEFIILYKAVTDRTTVINLTNHCFFNLAGISNPTPTILSNILTINADYYIPTDDVSIPTGEILKVANTPFDFRLPHVIGDRIEDRSNEQIGNGAGYDKCYVLNKKEFGELSFAAKCIEPKSHRSMEVYTTEPGMQLYTGNWLNGFEGTHGATYPSRSAVSFETQHFPDSPNHTYFPSTILNSEEEYEQLTIYKFGVE